MVELAMLADQYGRFNHKVVTHPASSLAQDRESSPAETRVLTTMLYRNTICTTYGIVLYRYYCSISLGEPVPPSPGIDVPVT